MPRLMPLERRKRRMTPDLCIDYPNSHSRVIVPSKSLRWGGMRHAAVSADTTSKVRLDEVTVWRQYWIWARRTMTGEMIDKCQISQRKLQNYRRISQNCSMVMTGSHENYCQKYYRFHQRRMSRYTSKIYTRNKRQDGVDVQKFRLPKAIEEQSNTLDKR